MPEIVVLAGSANPALARNIANELSCESATAVSTIFPDGEVAVELPQTVRGKHVLVIQPTSPPVNDHLVELLTPLLPHCG
jgi:ribose-phosphate pyrophosphokinase